ncbi:sugar ABC transporter substrate-binding protein [bacterium]|nr:sugar ABC transporter substrate-binding protein [bacterium]
MKRVSVWVTVLGIGILTALAGCQRGSGDGAVQIALVVKTLNHPFFMDMEQGARRAADSLGVRLIVQGPEREVDVEKQMQIIENLIQRRVNALCVAPCGSREIVPAIVKANRDAIPVLVVDTRVDTETLRESGGTTACFIGSDNYQGGVLAGREIIARLNGTGRVALLEGIPGHETGDERKRGFLDALNDAPGITVVASQTANWERDQGYTVFQNILQAHPETDGLFACNDLMALGALEAIAAAGREGDILVIGFDALQDARDAIAAGTMTASVAQHPQEMGRQAVLNAYRLLAGESVPREIPVPITLVTAGPDSAE